MQVSLRIASASKETGALLKEYLEMRDVYHPKGKAVVSYGVHLCSKKDPKILNGVCARGKIFNMEAMQAAEIQTVPWFCGDRVPDGFKFPLFARRSHGCGGEDLMPVFHPQEVPWRVRAGWDWFSTIIPVLTEYRVWTFRGDVLDTYEKVMQRPHEFKFMGRNFRNGFEFKRLLERGGPVAAQRLAVRATKCLDLDFAAVDLLEDPNGHFYVLECNTAPGVLRSGAQSTLAKLADRITEWAWDLNADFE